MQENIISNIKELNEKFLEIRKKEYIRGIYNNLSAIGRTFEEELGLERNIESIPDYKGIEVKTRRTYSKSVIGLFNAVPNGKNELELKRIKDTYGYPCSKDKRYKSLYAEIYGNKPRFAGVKYQYKLEVNKKDKKVYLNIYDRYLNLIDNEAYWTFDYLKQRLETKLSFLALIDVWPKEIKGWNYFKYYKIRFYVLKRFSKFLTLIEDGKIKFTFKVGIYLDEANYGKTYDHGCSFGIKESDINELFYEYDIENNLLK